MSRVFMIATDDGTIGRFTFVGDDKDDGTRVGRLVSCGVAGSAEAINSILRDISVHYADSGFAAQMHNRKGKSA